MTILFCLFVSKVTLIIHVHVASSCVVIIQSLSVHVAGGLGKDMSLPIRIHLFIRLRCYAGFKQNSAQPAELPLA